MAERDCGLYVTGIPLPGKEDSVPAGALVYFHNHSKEGVPIVLPPDVNTQNHWRFAERGWLVQGSESAAFLAALSPRPAQGWYVVVTPVQVTDGVLPTSALVQVGYNKSGHPILFPAHRAGNGFAAPDRGFRFEDPAVLSNLKQAGFTIRGPASDGTTEKKAPKADSDGSPPTFH